MLGDQVYHAKRSTRTKVGHGAVKRLNYHRKDRINIIKAFPNHIVGGDISGGGNADGNGGRVHDISDGSVEESLLESQAASTSMASTTSTSMPGTTSTSTFQYTSTTTIFTHPGSPIQESATSSITPSPTSTSDGRPHSHSTWTFNVLTAEDQSSSSSSTLASQFPSSLSIISISELSSTEPPTLLPTELSTMLIQPTVSSPSVIVESPLNIGAIVGGSVGGLLVLGLLAGLISWWVIRRRRRRIAPSAAYKAIYGTESPFTRSASTEPIRSRATTTG